MNLSSNWTDYEIIASGGGEKLERWGDVYLLRPDPQAIWTPTFNLAKFDGLHAHYIRSNSGGGSRRVPDLQSRRAETARCQDDECRSRAYAYYRHARSDPDSAFCTSNEPTNIGTTDSLVICSRVTTLNGLRGRTEGVHLRFSC